MDSITISTVISEGLKITAVTDGNVTAFAGVANNNVLNIEQSMDRERELLLRAVNNRTRERNFFRLYADLLENVITEEEYNRQLEEHEDDFVQPLPVDASTSDIETAVRLSEHIKDIKSMDDFQSLFSFNDVSIHRAITSQK